MAELTLFEPDPDVDIVAVAVQPALVTAGAINAGTLAPPPRNLITRIIDIFHAELGAAFGEELVVGPDGRRYGTKIRKDRSAYRDQFPYAVISHDATAAEIRYESIDASGNQPFTTDEGVTIAIWTAGRGGDAQAQALADLLVETLRRTDLVYQDGLAVGLYHLNPSILPRQVATVTRTGEPIFQIAPRFRVTTSGIEEAPVVQETPSIEEVPAVQEAS